MATLKEYWLKDFNRILAVTEDHKAISDNGIELKFQVRVHMDFDACTKYISIFAPIGVDPISIAKFYSDDPQSALKVADGVGASVGFGQLPHHGNSDELTFSGRFFLYSEQELSKEKVIQIASYCNSKGIKFCHRGPSYSDERNRLERPAAFISHDSRDKKDVALPLALELQRLMCPVWFDEFSLKIGDSLRGSIERGIRESKTCIVILSENFLSNTGWSKAEFDSIYTREIIENQNVFLPVWHNVTEKMVYEYCPRLVDRFAGNTDAGISELAKKLFVAINAT